MNDMTVKVSIIIKALNEEKNIKRTIESALKAVSVTGSGEVILADSLSTDHTVEIASHYPVKIVQLVDEADRCCGVGAQLGYLISSGEYIYILDGDMEIDEHFLPNAIKHLESNPKLAGVAGVVQEMCLNSLEFQRRIENSHVHKSFGLVDRLDMGGLYRRVAIQQVGYLTNQSLHAYEELELAARLQTNDWLLERINIPAVKHYGHTTEAFTLMLKRWKTRYSWGLGELLASSLGKKHMFFILLHVKQLYLYSAVLLWWLFLIASILLFSINTAIGLLAIKALILLIMSIKKGGVKRGVYSIFSWNINAASLIAGVTSFFSAESKTAVRLRQIK